MNGLINDIVDQHFPKLKEKQEKILKHLQNIRDKAKENKNAYDKAHELLSKGCDLEERGHGDIYLNVALDFIWTHGAYAGADCICICGRPCEADWKPRYDEHPEVPTGHDWLSDCCELKTFERGHA